MVDARGFLCPMPVVMVQKEVKANKPDALDVLVDDPCAVENVTRFAPFKKELDYLQNALPARGTVEELAELHGVSRENFSRSFTRETCMTPKQFLTQVTLSRACRKLITETNTIREIALELGFSNEFYFSNFFRKHTGESPSHFRQKMK